MNNGIIKEQLIKVAFIDYGITKNADALSRAFKRGALSLKNAIKATKKLKLKPRFLKSVGGEREGVANLMTHPSTKNGLAINKIYNPKSGIFYPGRVEDEINLLKKMNGKYFPKYLGKTTAPNSLMKEYIEGSPVNGGRTMHWLASKFPSLSSLPSTAPGQLEFFDNYFYGKKHKAMKFAHKATLNTFRKTGILPRDIVGNPSNIIKGKSGYKAIDFIPTIASPGKTNVAQVKLEKMIRRKPFSVARDWFKNVPLKQKIKSPITSIRNTSDKYNYRMFGSIYKNLGLI